MKNEASSNWITVVDCFQGTQHGILIPTMSLISVAQGQNLGERRKNPPDTGSATVKGISIQAQSLG